MRIFLVDDEALALDDLAGLIDWRSHGYTIAGTETDSGRAYDACLERSVDLLITDIRMPGMDGIELSRRVKRVHPQMMVILLTGYKDFDYAWRAIEIHADAYLLKDAIDAESLFSALKRCEQKLEAARQAQQMIQERKLRDILLSKDGFASHRPKGALLHLAMIIRDDGFPLFPAYAGIDPGPLDLSGVKEVLDESMCMNYGRGAFAAMWSSVGDAERARSIRAALKRFAKAQVECCYTLLIAPPIMDREALRVWHMRCLWVDENLAFLGAAECALDYSQGRPWDISQEDPPRADYRALEEALAQQDENSIVAAIKALFVPFHPFAHIGGLRAVVSELIFRLEKVQRDASIPALREDASAQCLRFHALHEMEAFFAKRFSEAMRQSRSMRGIHTPVLEKALNWMRANYSQNIALTDVSAAISISSVYLSQLFRRQAQTTFSDELTQIRIQVAKYLLRNTDLKVFEIARQTGFQKSQYFSQVFKGKTGMTPNEYRNANTEDRP